MKVERLVKEVLPIKRIPLCRAKPSVADNPSQLFLGRAVSHPGGANHVFFEHHRTHIVPAKTQTHLADFESLRDPARLHVEEVREIKSRDGEDLQVIDRRGFVPVPSAQGSVLRLKAPRDERREPARFLLQFVEALEVVDAVLIILSHAKHHGRGGAHADLMRGAMHVEPVFCKAFEPRDFVADFVVQNFSPAARNGIETRITQPQNGVTNAEIAVLRNGDNFRRRVAMQMDLGKAFLNPTQHFLVPIDLEIRMQPALHQHSRSIGTRKCCVGLRNAFPRSICIATRRRKLSPLRSTAISAFVTPFCGCVMRVSIPFLAAGLKFWTTKSATKSRGSNALQKTGSTCIAPRIKSACAPPRP